MFGVSFLEIALVGLVALVIVGPQKLPEMMRTAGEWIGKLRRLTADMRAQTGIDDILREEGIDGVAELRTLLKGERAMANRRAARGYSYDAPAVPPDPAVEFPVEGPDAKGALPDDLLSNDEDNAETPSETEPPAAACAKPSIASKPSVAVKSTSAAKPAPASKPPRAPSASKPPTPSRPAPPSRPGRSIPPPPATPRPIPPRAPTHRETPASKLAPTVPRKPPAAKMPEKS